MKGQLGVVARSTIVCANESTGHQSSAAACLLPASATRSVTPVAPGEAVPRSSLSGVRLRAPGGRLASPGVRGRAGPAGYFANRWTKARAVSATSRQPLSIVSA